jgi:TMEM175 potassium channel family protein
MADTPPRADFLMASHRDTARTEAFSDGVFAIAMTLLVLDIKVPHDVAPPGSLLQALAHQWPVYLAFLTSFATILIMWINHHRLFTHISRCDDQLLFFNGLLLLGVVLVPFPTSLVAEYLGQTGQTTAAMVYNGTFIAIAICFNLLWRSASKHGRLLHEDHDRDAVAQITESYRRGPLAYVLALVLAFVSVTASLLLNLALAVYFGLPSRTAAGIGRRRHAERNAL